MIRRVEYDFEAALWLYPGEGGWHFVTVPVELTEELREVSGPRRGFGAVRVRVEIGASAWETSIFPDSKSGAYLLPVKKQVRAKEGVEDGDVVAVRLRIVS